MGRIVGLRWAEEAWKASHYPICLHAPLLKQGILSHTSIANTVVSFYFRQREIKTALGIFRSMDTVCRDSVSWNIVIHGFFRLNHFEKGLRWFTFARRNLAFLPNVSTLVLLLNGCADLENKNIIEPFHAYLIKSGFLSSRSICNSLLKVAGEHSSQKLFDEMSDKDIVSWSMMVSHYVQSGNPCNALDCFRSMISQNAIELDAILLVTVIYACAMIGSSRLASSAHGVSIRQGLDDLYVKNTIIDAYSKCGCVYTSFKIFTTMNDRNQVSWNSMLSAFVVSEHFHEAIELLRRLTKEVTITDDVVLVNILKLSKQLENPHWAKMIHCNLIRNSNCNKIVINSLIDAYASCNLVDRSYEIFVRIKSKDMIMWSTMISAFAHNGNPRKAISVFEEMNRVKVAPNSITVLNLIKACAVSTVPRWCKWVHGVAVRGGYARDITIGTAVLNMYSKCGEIGRCRKVFDRMLEKSMVTWSAMIDACATNGEAAEALRLVREMREAGFRANWLTVLSVVSACRHAGLVEEGVRVLKEANVALRGEHYACVADMLGKAGMCHVAADVMRGSSGLEGGWSAVLSGSRSCGNMEVGEEAYRHVVEMEPLGYAGYVAWSSMASSNGAWGKAEEIRLAAAQNGVQTAAGFSSLHSGGQCRTFVAGDWSKLRGTFVVSVLRHLHAHLMFDST